MPKAHVNKSNIASICSKAGLGGKKKGRRASAVAVATDGTSSKTAIRSGGRVDSDGNDTPLRGLRGPGAVISPRLLHLRVPLGTTCWQSE